MHVHHMYSVALSCCTTPQSAITLALALYMCHYKTVSTLYPYRFLFKLQDFCVNIALFLFLFGDQSCRSKAPDAKERNMWDTGVTRPTVPDSRPQLVKSPWSARFTGVLSKSPNKGAALKKVSHSNSSARQSSNTIPVTLNVTCKSAVSRF